MNAQKKNRVLGCSTDGDPRCLNPMKEELQSGLTNADRPWYKVS